MNLFAEKKSLDTKKTGIVKLQQPQKRDIIESREKDGWL